jgi:hypothetical protein
VFRFWCVFLYVGVCILEFVRCCRGVLLVLLCILDTLVLINYVLYIIYNIFIIRNKVIEGTKFISPTVEIIKLKSLLVFKYEIL